jgi:hypothetical protein
LDPCWNFGIAKLVVPLVGEMLSTLYRVDKGSTI